MKKLTIHSTPADELAYHQERSADSLDSANNKLDKVHQAIKDIPQTIIPEPKEFPKEMMMSIKGVSVMTLKGDDGKTPTKEELLSLIEPLIPPAIP